MYLLSKQSVGKHWLKVSRMCLEKGKKHQLNFNHQNYKFEIDSAFNAATWLWLGYMCFRFLMDLLWLRMKVLCGCWLLTVWRVMCLLLTIEVVFIEVLLVDVHLLPEDGFVFCVLWCIVGSVFYDTKAKIGCVCGFCGVFVHLENTSIVFRSFLWLKIWYYVPFLWLPIEIYIVLRTQRWIT